MTPPLRGGAPVLSRTIAAFTRSELDALLGLAEKGITEIIALQNSLVAEAPEPR